jgi:hypothetical protein
LFEIHGLNRLIFTFNYAVGPGRLATRNSQPADQAFYKNKCMGREKGWIVKNRQGVTPKSRDLLLKRQQLFQNLLGGYSDNRSRSKNPGNAGFLKKGVVLGWDHTPGNNQHIFPA